MRTNIEVSAQVVIEFKNKIQTFDNDCRNNVLQIKTYYDELINFTYNLVQKLEKSIEHINRVLMKAEKKYKQLEKELRIIESELRSTPPTITETHCDSEGNVHTSTSTNPRYTELQRALREVQNKIYKVQSVIAKSNTLKTQMQSEFNTLQTSIKEFTMLWQETDSDFKMINENNFKANEKLDKIIRIVENYMQVSINGGWI